MTTKRKHQAIIDNLTESIWRQQLLVLFIAFISLFVTLYPTVYTFDSAELTIGAAKLGIVHAPGYALYTLLAHSFSYLPIGDMGYRVNLFSAVCLALSAPIVYTVLLHFIKRKLVVSAAVFCFMWSVDVWKIGVIAEVYALQILTLAISLWSVLRLKRHPNSKNALVLGISYGLAVAAHLSSILFVPAVVIVLLRIRITRQQRFLSLVVASAVFLLTIAFFPLRQNSSPVWNYAGQYTSDGTFQQVDLQTLDGLWWLLSGRQFESLFFADGYVASWEQLSATISLLWSNFFGIGLLFGVVGSIVFLRRHRMNFLLWLIALLPYTYFYTTYGATDRNTMFGPVFLCWSIVFAFGLDFLVKQLPKQAHYLVLLLPFIMLMVNLPHVTDQSDTNVRTKAEATMVAIPQNALVFGIWGEVVPLEYLQIIENQRPDLELYNLFFFDDPSLQIFLENELSSKTSRSIVFLGNYAPKGIDTRLYTIAPFRVEDKNGDIETSGFVLRPIQE